MSSELIDGPPVPNARRARTRKVLTLAVVALVVAAIAWVLIQGWDAVAGYDWSLRPGWLVLGSLLMMLGYAITGLTYGSSVAMLSPTHPSVLPGLSLWGRSLLARYVPGSVLMVVSRVELAHKHGVPRRATLAATIYEQILTLGVGAIGAVIFLAAYGSPGNDGLIWLLVAVPLILGCLHPIPFRRLSNWAFRKARRPPLDAAFNGRQVGRLLALYALATIPVMVGVWALVRSAAGPEAGGVIEIGLAFLLAYVISFLAFVLPSGIGVRDGILALVLARHVPGEVALALSVGLRFAMVIIELLFVGLVTLAGRTR